MKNRLNEFKKKIEKRKRVMVITIFGAYWPPDEKQLLRELVEFLKENGYARTKIIEDYPQQGLTDLQVSLKYLRKSDINFFIFTNGGKQGGVARELSEIILNPKLKYKIPYCTVFDLLYHGHTSISNLFWDDKDDVHLRIDRESNIEELKQAMLGIAFYYILILGDLLDKRKINKKL